MQKGKLFLCILDKRLLFFCVLALALRAWGVDFGLPYLYHQDEPRIVDHGLKALVNQLNPEYFVVPGFTMYVTAFCGGVVYLYGILTGVITSPDEFLTRFLSDPSSVYLMARWLVGIIPGTLCVGAVYLFARRLFDQVTASKAALLTACVPILVQHSHYIYTESLLALGIFILTMLLISADRNASLSNFIWIGVMLGWSTSIKYTALYFVPVMLFRYFQIFGKSSFRVDALKKITTAMAVSFLVYVVFSPYSIIAWSDFWNTIQTQSEAENPVGLFHHLFYSLGYGVGPIVLMLALLGVSVWFRRNRSTATFALVWCGFYYMINVHFSQPFARYAVPLVPIVCLFAGYGWKIARDRLSEHQITLGLLNVLVIASVLIPTVQSNLLFASEDTRTAAKQWIEANIEQDSGIALSSRAFSPRLRQSNQQILNKLSDQDVENPSPRINRQLKLMKARNTETPYRTYAIEWEAGLESLPYFSIQPLIAPDRGLMIQNDIEFLLVDSQEFQAYSTKFLSENSSRLESVIQFSPYKSKKRGSVDPYDSTALPHAWPELLSRKSSGPYIEIYKILKDAAK